MTFARSIGGEADSQPGLHDSSPSAFSPSLRSVQGTWKQALGRSSVKGRLLGKTEEDGTVETRQD